MCPPLSSALLGECIAPARPFAVPEVRDSAGLRLIALLECIAESGNCLLAWLRVFRV